MWMLLPLASILATYSCISFSNWIQTMETFSICYRPQIFTCTNEPPLASVWQSVPETYYFESNVAKMVVLLKFQHCVGSTIVHHVWTLLYTKSQKVINLSIRWNIKQAITCFMLFWKFSAMKFKLFRLKYLAILIQRINPLL